MKYKTKADGNCSVATDAGTAVALLPADWQSLHRQRHHAGCDLCRAVTFRLLSWSESKPFAHWATASHGMLHDRLKLSTADAAMLMLRKIHCCQLCPRPRRCAATAPARRVQSRASTVLHLSAAELWTSDKAMTAAGHQVRTLTCALQHTHDTEPTACCALVRQESSGYRQPTLAWSAGGNTAH